MKHYIALHPDKRMVVALNSANKYLPLPHITMHDLRAYKIYRHLQDYSKKGIFA